MDTQTTMNDNASEQTGYRAPAVREAFRILRTVAEYRQVFSLSEISQMLGFSKSTIPVLVNALFSEGVRDQNPHSRKFSLGSTVVDLALGSWNYLRVSETAQPFLAELGAKSLVLGHRIEEAGTGNLMVKGANSGSAGMFPIRTACGRWNFLKTSPPCSARPCPEDRWKPENQGVAR